MNVGANGAWWFPQSSKLMRPDNVGLGGFDSHALPPRRAVRRDAARLSVFAVAALAVVTVLSRPAAAQRADAARTGIVGDTGAVPVSPGKAFLYSVAIPGWGQSKLDRPVVGAGFFLVEALAIAMVHRTADDVRLARAFSRDSLPLRYVVDPTTGIPALDANGNPQVAEWEPARYSDQLLRTRKLQLEDWTAVLIFNHLIAGAEAFVASQLWDLPQHVSLRTTPLRRGIGVAVSVTTR